MCALQLLKIGRQIHCISDLCKMIYQGILSPISYIILLSMPLLVEGGNGKIVMLLKMTKCLSIMFFDYACLEKCRTVYVLCQPIYNFTI